MSYQENTGNQFIAIYLLLYPGWQFVTSQQQILTHYWPETHISTSLVQFSQFSCSVMSDSLWPHESQHTRPPFPSPTPGVYPNLCTLSWWCYPAIHPLSSHSPPAPNPSQHQGLFQWVNSSYDVAKVLEFQLQHQSFQWTPRTDLL